ncbi:hypothetical protein V1264_007719 [Littorina saxatilis]|uniref:Cytochrome P450 n=2 Tax=Littorina saxatilis TaxID=31220 RepID=A0AAN9AX04_9CAEN
MHSDLSPREVESFLHAYPFEEIPGPTAIHQSIPFASTRLLYYPFSSYKVENLGDMLSKLQTVYGPVFRVQIGAEWVVLVDDMDDIERVVRSAELEEERGVRLLPKSKGPLDRLQRRVDDPSLSWLNGGHTFSKKMREAICFHVNSFDVKTEGLREQERIAEDFICNLQRLQDSPTELQNLCARYAYESVGHTCFSQRLGLLGENYNSDRERQNLLQCYQTVVRCLGETMTGTRVLHLLFEDPFAKRFREAKRTVQDWERELVREATMTKIGENGASLEGPSQKSLLVALMDDKTLSDQEIQDAMHSIVTAGGDIISNALQMMLYSLATNRDKQEKLVTELERTLTPDFEIDIINLNCSDYLNAVVRESLRLHFPLSAGGRVELANNVVLNNYFVPAGTHIVVNSRTAAKNPLWFNHPNSFEPERWLGEEGDKIPSQAFLPFGFANSLCPTSFFSMQKFQLALVKILDRYKVDLPSEYHTEQLETVYTPFLAPKDPLPFIFTPRDRSKQPRHITFGFPGIPPK